MINGRRLPTMRDVALLAGVSVATVSNVLNHPERVKPDRRDTVLAAMQDLKYVPNEPARALRLGATSQQKAHHA